MAVYDRQRQCRMTVSPRASEHDRTAAYQRGRGSTHRAALAEDDGVARLAVHLRDQRAPGVVSSD